MKEKVYRAQVSVLLPIEDIAWLDAQAVARGVSRAAVIHSLVEKEQVIE